MRVNIKDINTPILVLFVLMGGFIVMLFCQLFLGMGAIGSQPKFQQEAPAEYAYDKV